MKDRILAKYNLPTIRFKTNESMEKTRLVDKLNEIQQEQRYKVQESVQNMPI